MAIERRLVEAEHEVRAGLRAAAQLVDVAGIDADLEAVAFSARDRVLEMRETDVRAGSRGRSRRRPRRISSRARSTSCSTVEPGASTISAKMRMSCCERSGGVPPLAEEVRQVGDLVGPALERHAEMLGVRSPRFMRLRPGTIDAVGVERRLEAVPHDRLGHQGGDLHADVGDAP